MAKKNDNSLHWIIGIVLLITGVLIIAALVVTYSQGEDVNANVNIDNDAPIIDTANAEVWQDPGDDGTNIAVSGFAATPGPTITHTIAGNTNVIVKVNVTDSNGWASQPINLSARLMRTSAGGTSPLQVFEFFGGILDHSAHPSTPAVCTAIANVSSTERTFLCGANMTYNSVPTTPASPKSPTLDFSNEHWRVLLKASDGVVNVEALDSVHYEFPLGVGLSTGTVVDLGSIATDGTVGSLVPLSIQNTGNQQIDTVAQVTGATDAASWSCTGTGNPLVSDVHLIPTGGDTNYAGMNPLNFNGEAFQHTGFDLIADNASSSPGSQDLNFRMATTQGITPGTCTLSSVVLSAIKGF